MKDIASEIYIREQKYENGKFNYSTLCTQKEYEDLLTKMPKNVSWEALAQYEKEELSSSDPQIHLRGNKAPEYLTARLHQLCGEQRQHLPEPRRRQTCNQHA